VKVVGAWVGNDVVFCEIVGETVRGKNVGDCVGRSVGTGDE
jgi:hypothetical protein